jgi:hypothetical protein
MDRAARLLALEALHFVGIWVCPIRRAFVGGLFVLRAQLLANWAQRERDRQTERQTLTGTLRAIQAEVLVLRADFLMHLWDLLKAAEPGPFPTMPVQKNFFVVFESNADVLGRTAIAAAAASEMRLF